MVILFIGYCGYINTSQYNYGHIISVFESYPSMSFIERHICKIKTLNKAIVLSISEMTEENYKKLYPDHSL